MVIFDCKFKIIIVNNTRAETILIFILTKIQQEQVQNQKLTLVKRIDVVKTKYLSTHSPAGTDASGAVL